MANGKGNGRGRASADDLKDALGRIGAAIAVSLVLIGLAHLFLRRESDRPESPGVAVFNWLGQLPTEPVFHYLVAVLAGAYLGWRWYLLANLREEIRANEDKGSLTPHDWWVVRGLRGRALAFRTLAGILLGGVFALLFSGIYLAMFVVPQIPASDQFLTQEILLTNAKQQFSRRLQLIGEGRYWFKVADVGQDTPTSEEGSISELLKTANAQLAEMVLPAGATLPRLPALNTYEISKDEVTIFSIDHGKALVTRDGGETWSTPKGLVLEESEGIIAAAFDEDGRFGVVGSVGGSTFVTQDGGETWNVPKNLDLKESEWIVAAAFGPDGRLGVVGGDEGSAFVTQDGGKNWNVPKNLDLKESEWIVVSAFGPDGLSGVVGGIEGSAFVTQDGGENWNIPERLMLKEDEWIAAATFGANNTYGVISNNKGSIFLTKDSGKTWSAPKDSAGKDLALEETEWIITAAFDADGQSGVVVGDEGSIFVTQDSGKIWSVPENLVLKDDESIITTVFDADGRSGVVAGDKGSVFITQDRGKTWSVPENLVLKDDESIITAKFDVGGQFGVVAGHKGSVFVTQDRGKTWSDSDDLKLNENERIVAAAFSTDGKYGVVTGGEGSVFATQSSGRSWISTERDYQGTIFIDVVSAFPGGRNFVAVDDDGGIHLLKPYPDMAEWKNQSLAAIRIRIQEDEILRKSVIGREITKSLDSVLSADVNIDDGEALKPGNDEAPPSPIIGELMGIRVVILIALLFLVQILVRLYQYSLRLAAFWDARADAVLLARSFAYHSAETFDDLVAALAPDAYDFRSSPKSGHEAVMNLAGQLLRRESRKS